MRKFLYLASIVMLLVSACSSKEPAGSEETDTAPAAPTGVQLIARTPESLTFQWTAVQGASSYHWRLLEGITELKTADAEGTQVTIAGLQEGKTYGFSVRSVNAAGKSAYSATVNGTPEVQEEEPTIGPCDYASFLIPAAEEDGQARAFPGAEGGGMWTTGGRGGEVYHVTTLNDSGSGSLRQGVTKRNKDENKKLIPRTIVFDVAGIIALESSLKIEEGDLTIAGQSAPGDGICLKNYNLRIHANNVIVRFIRCRMGDERKTEDDALNIYTSREDHLKNIIIDHCSLSWSTDECGTFYGMTHFTLQWCVLSESLLNSVHDKGKHGYGGIWGGTDATYHHNLLAHHYSRNPRLDHDYVSALKGPVSLVNNVIYNWGDNSTYGGESANDKGEYRKYNLINNYYKPGPATESGKYRFIDPWNKACSNCTSKTGSSTIEPGHFFLSGNIFEGKADWSADNWQGTTAKAETIEKIKSSVAFTSAGEAAPFTLHSAQDAFSAVLEHAGASRKRDAVDQRIADETRKGTFTYSGSNGGQKGFIDTQSDVGGWPTYRGHSYPDTDGDGIPDYVEDTWHLNKADAEDALAKTLDPSGRYTNLEMYLHYLVKDVMAGGIARGSYSQL